MIYMIHAPHVAAMKIGYAVDVASRLRNIQAMSPCPLVLARTIKRPRQAEWWLHSIYDLLRLHGEWFRYVDEMLTIEVPERFPKVKRLESRQSVLRREMHPGDLGMSP